MYSFAIDLESKLSPKDQWVSYLSTTTTPVETPEALPIVAGTMQKADQFLSRHVGKSVNLPYLHWQQLSKICFRRVTLILNDFDSVFPKQSALDRVMETLRKGLTEFKEGFFESHQYAAAAETLSQGLGLNGWNFCPRHVLGSLKLFVPGHIDPEQAAQHFDEAARDVLAHMSEEQWSLAEILLKTLPGLPPKQDVDHIKKLVASECYFLAGLASYIHANFSEAVEFTSKAFHLYSDFSEAAFLHAKSLAALGRNDEVEPILANLIRQQDVYAIKTAMDGDLGRLPEIVKLLERHRDEWSANMKTVIDSVKARMIPTSAAKSVVGSLLDSLKTNTTVDLLEADHELRKKRDWSTTKLLINYRLINTLSRHSDTVKSIAFDTDDTFLASGSSDSGIVLWNLHTNREYRRLIGHSNGVDSIVFTPDGQFLFSGGGDTAIQKWNCKSGRRIARLVGHSHNVDSLSVSPDGKTLASGADDSTILLWNTETGENIRSLAGHANGINSIRFNHDGRLLASASSDNTVKIWKVESGSNTLSLTGHRDSVNAVRFSPDGHLLASAGSDRIIKIWDIETGEELHALTGHVGPIYSLAFHPEGHILASAGADTTIKLWDISAGKELTTVLGNTTGIQSLAFSHDGATLACGGEKGIVRIWSKRLLPLKSSTVVMNLTCDVMKFVSYERHNEDEMLVNVKELGRVHYQQEKERERERWFNAYKLCEEGKREEYEQDRKWFLKDYSEALKLYQQALDLGYEEALERIEKLRRKMSRR